MPTCMAGVAEKCAHVAALLYKIDTAVRLRGLTTPTDVEAYWVMPSNVTKVQGVPGHAIDFPISSARKKSLEQSICGETDAKRSGKIRTRSAGTSIPKRRLQDLKLPVSYLNWGSMRTNEAVGTHCRSTSALGCWVEWQKEVWRPRTPFYRGRLRPTGSQGPMSLCDVFGIRFSSSLHKNGLVHFLTVFQRSK